jgi:hypothetical protein
MKPWRWGDGNTSRKDNTMDLASWLIRAYYPARGLVLHTDSSKHLAVHLQLQK